MALIDVNAASFFFLPLGKSNSDSSQSSRQTATQSSSSRSNHNFLSGAVVIILFFTSSTEISSCFLQLSKRSFRTRVQSLRLFHLCTASPSKATLPKPLRNLLTLRCSFSWMESRYSCTLTSNSPGNRKRKTERQTLMITGRPPCHLELLHSAAAPHL